MKFLNRSFQAQYLDFPDSGDVHGALLVLAELAAAFRSSSNFDLEVDRKKVIATLIRISLVLTPTEIFMYLQKVPSSVVLSNRQELITAAACKLISQAISVTDIESIPNSNTPQWRSIIEFGLKSANISVQEAAAEAMASISTLCDCSKDVER